MMSFLASHPCPTLPVITCDTIIAQGGEILGKPGDYDEAYGFLRRFADTTHEVVSAYSFAYQGKNLQRAMKCVRCSSIPSVQMISARIYPGLTTGPVQEPYRIQDQIIPLVKEIQGNFSTVVGLPLEQISDIVLEPDSFRE